MFKISCVLACALCGGRVCTQSLLDHQAPTIYRTPTNISNCYDVSNEIQSTSQNTQQLESSRPAKISLA